VLFACVEVEVLIEMSLLLFLFGDFCVTVCKVFELLSKVPGVVEVDVDSLKGGERKDDCVMLLSESLHKKGVTIE